MTVAGYDAIVVGGGHNGLVAATLIARAGRRVLVCEAHERLGGQSITEEFHPGFKASTVAHLLHLMPERLERELGLAGHGLVRAAEGLPTMTLQPGGERTGLDAEGLARHGRADAEALPAFQTRLARLAGALAPMLHEAAPAVVPRTWKDRLIWLRLGLGLRRLGTKDMRELLRIAGMHAADLLDDTFATDVVKGALAFDAVLGTGLGPRSPGTVFHLLYRAAGRGLALPMGGMGAVAEALAAAARAAGAELRAATPILRLAVRQGRVQGVVLADGAEIAAQTVLANGDPKRLFLDLVGADHLDTGFVRRVHGLRTGGMNAKVNLALDGLPEPIAGAPARFLVAPAIDDLERAFDAAKYGAVPVAPGLEVTVPTATDPSLAPPGKHVLSVVVQYAPYKLAQGDWDERRDALGDAVVKQLDQHIPGLANRVVARQVLTPADLARRTGSTGGHWHQVELALDTLFVLRPMPGMARYRTPIEGLYLCGAGAHPGGGVMGAAGANAARAVLADWKRKVVR